MKASINLERFKENVAIAFPNHRTQRANRLNLNRKKDIKVLSKREAQMQRNTNKFI